MKLHTNSIQPLYKVQVYNLCWKRNLYRSEIYDDKETDRTDHCSAGTDRYSMRKIPYLKMVEV